MRNNRREEVIKLPLADNATDEVKQDIRKFINENPEVMNFIRRYSILDDGWWYDQCFICGCGSNGCNCDGYYNPRGN